MFNFKFGRKPSHSDLARKLVVSLRKSKIPTIRQFSYLKKILKPWEIRLIRILGLVILINLIFLNIHQYRASTKLIPAVGGVYREGLVGFPQRINPLFATHSPDLDIGKLVFSGLFKYDSSERQDLVPDLVEKYSISPDGLTYQLTLKPNVYWHDGEYFSTDDVIFTIESIKDPEYKSPLFSGLKDVEVKKINERVLELTLPEAYAPFLGTLTFGVLPEHILKDIPPATAYLAEYNTKPIGTGPFKVKSFKKDKQGIIHTFELERNEMYFQDPPYLKQITFKFYVTRQEALAALKNKNINGFGLLPDPSLQPEESLTNNQRKYQPTFAQYTALFFNQKKNELLKEEEVRDALSKSIDKNKIAQELFGNDVVVIRGPILPGLTLAEQGKTADFQETKEALQNFLQSAKNEKKELKIILTTSNTSEYVQIAQKIQLIWKELGAEVEIQTIESAKIRREIINPREYEILLTSVRVSADPDPYAFWHSSQRESPGLNLALFSSKEADQLIEEARTTNNFEQRKEKYLKLQEILEKDKPAVFLWASLYTYFVSRNISGINLKHLSGTPDRFANIEQWYVKQKRVWK